MQGDGGPGESPGSPFARSVADAAIIETMADQDERFAKALSDLRGELPPGQELGRPFVELFPISGTAISTLGDLLGSETLYASDAQAARLDELQFDLGIGPCWDALSTARPVLEPDLRHHPRRTWPSFSESAVADGVGSLFAFPLLVGSLRIGAVDMYSTRPVTLDRTQTRQAASLADLVGRQVLRQALIRSSLVDPEEPESPFSRRLVHQATGMVLAQLDISADDARLVLQGHAFATGRTMMEVSRDVVDGVLDFSAGDDGLGGRGGLGGRDGLGGDTAEGTAR
jgi:GAF domain-containing protein